MTLTYARLTLADARLVSCRLGLRDSSHEHAGVSGANARARLTRSWLSRSQANELIDPCGSGINQSFRAMYSEFEPRE